LLLTQTSTKRLQAAYALHRILALHISRPACADP